MGMLTPTLQQYLVGIEQEKAVSCDKNETPEDEPVTQQEAEIKLPEEKNPKRHWLNMTCDVKHFYLKPNKIEVYMTQFKIDNIHDVDKNKI